MSQATKYTRRFGATFQALRHRDYRIFWFSSMLGGMGQWAWTVGQAWLVFQLSDSSLAVGVVTFGTRVPMLVVPILAGPLADWMDRRHFIMVTSLAGFVFGSIASVFVLQGTIQVWQLVIFAVLVGVTSAAEMPARQALLPNLVPKDELLNGVALSGVARHGDRFLGPAVTALLLATVGPWSVFAAAAIFYLLAAILMATVRTPSRGQVTSVMAVARNFREGAGYAGSRPMLGLLLVLVAFHCSLTMAFEPLLPVFVRDRLGSGGSTYGGLVMAIGIGALVGNLFLAGVSGGQPRGRWFLATALVSGLAPAALALSGVAPAALAAGVAIGASQGMWMSLNTSLVQAVLPDGLRGRISSLWIMFGGGIMAWAGLLNGFLADQWGAQPVLMAGGVLFVLVVALAGLFRPGLRLAYRTGAIPA
ncbi:MAG: MFS transporter [Chloroflexi bacterium]|nr:MFS transporter [Chloroflexota bacterium]